MEARKRTGSILSPSSARASRGRSAWPGADFASAGRRQKGRPSRPPLAQDRVDPRPRLRLKIQPQLFPKVCASYIYPLPAEIIVRVVLRLSRKTGAQFTGLARFKVAPCTSIHGGRREARGLAAQFARGYPGELGSCMPLRNSVLRFRSAGRTLGALFFRGGGAAASAAPAFGLPGFSLLAPSSLAP